ncbi:MAG: ABC transporter substrate-binding protein [Candidatus Limnocylindria bacterium]
MAKAKIRYAWPFAATTPAFQEELAKRFNEQSKTTEVEVEIIPQAQVVAKLTAAFSSGAGPDVLAMSPAWLTQFAAGGWLENMEEGLRSSGLEKDLLPVALAQGRMYKDTAYMIGSILDVYPLYYNKQIFADAGIAAPPATLDEFEEVARKLTDASKNRFGYYLLGGPTWSYQQWSTWSLNTAGIGVKNTLYDANKKSIVNSPQQVAGFERWAEMYRTAKVSPPASATATFQDASNAFSAGQIGMVMGFLGYTAAFTKSLGADKFGVAVTPAGPAGQFFHYGCNGFCIGAQSKNKDAAWEFVQYLLSAEVNELVNKEWGAIPTHRTALNAAYLKTPHFEAPTAMAQKDTAHVHTPRQLPEWARFFEKFAPEQIQKALLGQQTAQQSLDEMAKYLDDAMATSGA